MFLDQNEVSLFKISPWNALCKNGILLKIPLFQNQILRHIFQSNATTLSFLYIQRPFNVAEIIRIAIKKFRRFYRVPEKIVIFMKIKNYKISAMNLSSDCFVKNFFDPILRLSLQR